MYEELIKYKKVSLMDKEYTKLKILGVTDQVLTSLAIQDNLDCPKSHRHNIGYLYWIMVPKKITGLLFDARVRAVKLDENNYRFADTIEELEVIRVLHGVTPL